MKVELNLHSIFIQKGLDNFAARHADEFGKIDLIMLDGSNAKRFDLTEEKTHRKTMGIKLVDQIKTLMNEE